MHILTKLLFSGKISADRRLCLRFKYRNKLWELLSSPAVLFHDWTLCICKVTPPAQRDCASMFHDLHSALNSYSQMFLTGLMWHNPACAFLLLQFLPLFPLTTILAWLQLLRTAGCRGNWDKLLLTSSRSYFKSFAQNTNSWMLSRNLKCGDFCTQNNTHNWAWNAVNSVTHLW